MFSRDPTELTRKEKMDNEEISRSIRLDLAAELDAINFYLQQSRMMPDGSFKKVHEDIAMEEVAHFGEFLRLLYEYKPGDFSKIKEGWTEASELIGNVEEPGKFLDTFSGIEKTGGEKMESEQDKYMPHLKGFRKLEWEQDGIPLPEDQKKILPIERMSFEFSLSRNVIEPYREQEMKKNIMEYRRKLLKHLLLEGELSLGKRATSVQPGDWKVSGKILDDVIAAVGKLYDLGYPHCLKVISSPEAYRMMLRQCEDTGQTELDLIRDIVSDVEVNHMLEGKQVFVLHPESFWILIRERPTLRKISETSDSEHYMFECRVSSMLYDSKAAVNLKYSKK